MIRPGLWKSKEGNPFWINVINDKVYWLVMNQKSDDEISGSSWCHIGCGIIEGSAFTIEWADIPAVENKPKGKMVIEIINDKEIRVVDDSGDIGMSTCKWFGGGLSSGGF